jgi:hypothetical protein
MDYTLTLKQLLQIQKKKDSLWHLFSKKINLHDVHKLKKQMSFHPTLTFAIFVMIHMSIKKVIAKVAILPNPPLSLSTFNIHLNLYMP